MGPKAVLFKITGTPVAGDKVRLMYRSPRGGRTHAEHVVNPATHVITPETVQTIAADLVSQVDKNWMKEAFQPNLKDSTVVIHCSGLVGDVAFDKEVDTAGDLAVDMSEI